MVWDWRVRVFLCPVCELHVVCSSVVDEMRGAVVVGGIRGVGFSARASASSF